jgi:hypothetical protein
MKSPGDDLRLGMSFLTGPAYASIEEAKLPALTPDTTRAPAALPAVDLRLPEVKRLPGRTGTFLTAAVSGATPETMDQPLRSAPAPLPAADLELPKLEVKRPSGRPSGGTENAADEL